MKYAIIQSGGKQYKIQEGEQLLVDRLAADKDKPYVFPEVLMVRDGEKILIGTPYLNGIKVAGKVIGEEKGEKIYISKFKAKVRYRRKIGFRSQHTRILIESINSSDTVKETKKSAQKVKSTA